VGWRLEREVGNREVEETNLSSTTETSAASTWEGRFELRASYGHFIGGQEVDSINGASREATSPRDGAPIADIAWGSAEDVDAAVAAAKAAFAGEWRRVSAKDRSDLLLDFAAALTDAHDELAYLESIDNGKTIAAMTSTDMAVGLDAVKYFAAAARTLESRSAQMPDATIVHHELLEPYGVVAELLPWNGPIWTGLSRLSAIIAAGNTAVLKPSEVAGAPVLLRVCELATEAGFPAGVVNLVNGDGVVGEALVRHPDVGFVSLTGGTNTGARVLAAAAASITPVSLELGGKNPNLVFADGDLDQAIMWSGIGAFSNSGQICVAGSRVLVEEKVLDRFVEGVTRHAQGLAVGDPFDPATEIGPVVSEKHAEGVWASIETARGEGSIATGGEAYEGQWSHRTFIPPTVVVDLPADSATATKEIFGPVLAVIPFRTEAEAVAIANATNYGLSCGVFTRDVDRAWRVASALDSGEVYVNRWFTPGVHEAPAAGHDQSGLGEVGLRKYLQSKNLFFQLGAEA
jgi:acyl-CoA reductase-like NAD-dependent aldehyde dehydrogenase